MLGSFKDRILGKRKQDFDYSDVRSHVLGERSFPEPATVGEKFGIEKPPDFPEPVQRNRFAQDPYGPAPYDQPPAQQFQQAPRFGSRPDPRMDFGMSSEEPQARSNYDILDRLNLIESQLAAIRSQTETINERLKNIDARLAGRRY